MADYKIKVNKTHSGKEFKSSFRFIGQVGQVSKKDKDSGSWEKRPIYFQNQRQQESNAEFCSSKLKQR